MFLLDKYKNDNFLQIIDNYDLDDLIEFSKTVRVLFVHPETDEKKDLLSIFKIFFHDIDVSDTSEEAIILFDKNRYDLVVTIDEIDGLHQSEMITHIREISRNVTIIAILHDINNFLEFVHLGVDSYLPKPIKIELFIEIMKKLINTLLNKERIYEYRVDLENKIQEKTKNLIEINKTLEKRIEEEVNKNLKQQEQMFQQAKLASLGEMISNIAHQWRQPLSSISTLASSVRINKELGLLEDAELDQHMDNICTQTMYLSKTIDTFSKFINDKKELLIVNVLDKIVQSKIIVEASLKENGIKLHDTIDYNQNILIQAVTGELPQVLINILNNAKDVLVERNIENPIINLSIVEENNTIKIIIEDNAGGIPESIMSRIFEPYFTTKHQSQGTGLGLHMSYKIINDSMKGKLLVHNTNKGAQFTIELDKIN